MLNNLIKKNILKKSAAIILIIAALSLLGFTGCGSAVKVNDKGIAYVNNHLVCPETELRESAIEKAVQKFSLIRDKYLLESDGRIFLSVVPDKGYYIAKNSELNVMDYDKLFSIVSDSDWYTYIDITDTLSEDSYYLTDGHWKQECITGTADRICDAMGVRSFSTVELTEEEVAEFQGIYVKDADFSIDNDKIKILKNDVIDACQVSNVENEDVMGIYDLSKCEKITDAYDIYLGGPKSVEYIINPAGNPEKELIVFRDSYASALTPLLIKDYSKITLIDNRYVMTDLLADYVDFHGQDVLFIYSTPVLMRSSIMK